MAPVFVRFVALGLSLGVLAWSGRAGAEEPSPYASLSQPELEQALREKSLGGPIALLVAGGASFVVGGGLLVDGLIWGSDWYQDSANCTYCDDLSKPFTIAGLVAMGVGVPLAIGGGVWLGNRLGERRAIKHELKGRTKQSEVDVRYQIVPLADGFGVRAIGTF